MKKTRCSAWINAEKQQPQIDPEYGTSIYVLVTTGAKIGIGNYDFDEKRWNYHITGQNEEFNNDITHWMLLPKPPTI